MEVDDDDRKIFLNPNINIFAHVCLHWFRPAWAQLNNRGEVVETSSVNAESAMDTGNPWDSNPLASSTTVSF